MIRNSATADESSFWEYGQQVLRDHTTRRLQPFHNSKMVVNALQALPSFLSDRLDRVLPTQAACAAIQGGRLVSVLFTLLLAGYLFHWALQLFGLTGACMSLGLLVFCPNILAHGNLLTTDMPLTCLIFISVYYFARLQQEPSRAHFLLSALATGLAQLTKFTALHLLPLFACFTAIRFLRPPENLKQAPRNFARFFACCVLYGLIVWAVINTGFLWEHTFRPLKDFYAAGRFPAQGLLGKIPVPFAYGYFQGIVMTAHDDSYYPDWLYLLGHYSKHRFPLYFPLALLWKTPLGSLALFALSLFCKPAKEKFRARPSILVVMAYLFGYFTLFHGHQIGLRYLLPIFPFAYLCIGQITQSRQWIAHKSFRIFSWALFSWAIASSLSYYPHFIPYFNETIGKRINAYRYLGDSNLDWNQANWYKDRYLAQHPDVHPVNDPTPESKGIVLLRVNDVIGIQDPEKYRWLREKHQPVAHIAHAWLIYDLRREDG